MDAAAASLQRARIRPELELVAIPSPGPSMRSLAYSATVHGGPDREDRGEELATGRFVLYRDPHKSAEWGGTYRIVTYVRAQVERELGNDELLPSVAWSWLLDALSRSGARYLHEGGTATRMIADGFGELADTGQDIDVEMRASWTPADQEFRAHLQAWSDMLCTFAGLPPQLGP